MSKPEPAQAPQPQAQPGALSADQVAQLKSGEYLIHVFLSYSLNLIIRCILRKLEL